MHYFPLNIILVTGREQISFFPSYPVSLQQSSRPGEEVSLRVPFYIKIAHSEMGHQLTVEIIAESSRRSCTVIANRPRGRKQIMRKDSMLLSLMIFISQILSLSPYGSCLSCPPASMKRLLLSGLEREGRGQVVDAVFSWTRLLLSRKAVVPILFLLGC